MESPERDVKEPPIIPAGVTDIDAAEGEDNPQLCVEYASAIYAYLREVEDGLSIREDFLRA